jgi:Na+/H+ antiporter NhaC
MLLAAAVLFLAWITAEIISMLGVGEYLAGLIGGGLAFSLLPAILFVLACFILLLDGEHVRHLRSDPADSCRDRGLS